MTGQVDIYRAAQVVIKQHGENAESYARLKVRGFVDDGVLEGAALWQIIANAIVKLQEFEPNWTLH